MNAFIQTHLPAFARANPGIELSISPRPGKHPVLRGYYINGREKSVCVRNKSPKEVLEMAEYLRGNSGEKVRKSNRAGRRVVQSANESVRGVWDSFHGKAIFKV
jgi:large subunit ribosomal protein L43